MSIFVDHPRLYPAPKKQNRQVHRSYANTGTELTLGDLVEVHAYRFSKSVLISKEISIPHLQNMKKPCWEPCRPILRTRELNQPQGENANKQAQAVQEQQGYPASHSVFHLIKALVCFFVNGLVLSYWCEARHRMSHQTLGSAVLCCAALGNVLELEG